MNPDHDAARKLSEQAPNDGAAALVARMARGDEDAFSLLYDLHAPLLYGLACRIMGREQDAEEALQDAMLQAWRTAGKYDESKGSVRTWLVMMTRSRCLDRLRRRGTVSRREAPMPEGAAEPADDSLMAPEEMQQAETKAAVVAALAALPEAQRKVLDAAFYEGMTQAEIAERTGEPLGTVKTRMRLGMLKLMELLKPYMRG
jgi:RNA polymerase sigma-70 factor (ECF subfamily)